MPSLIHTQLRSHSWPELSGYEMPFPEFRSKARALVTMSISTWKRSCHTILKCPTPLQVIGILGSWYRFEDDASGLVPTSLQSPCMLWLVDTMNGVRGGEEKGKGKGKGGGGE